MSVPPVATIVAMEDAPSAGADQLPDFCPNTVPALPRAGTFSIQRYNFSTMEREKNNLVDLEALQSEAARFTATLSPSQENATLITLSGELGAGKTSFTQGVARTLGVTDAITSPTFVLEKIYELPEATSLGFTRLVHIDAYRLEGKNALTPLGFNELVQDAKNLILLEWPERVGDALPKATHQIHLSVGEGNTRDISYA